MDVAALDRRLVAGALTVTHRAAVMLSVAVLALASQAAPVANRSTAALNRTLLDVQDAAYHVHFCVDPVDCDRWALARPGSTSAMMPQECRVSPQATCRRV